MKEIKIDGDSPLFKKEEMQYKEFPSEHAKIRYYTLLLVSSAPSRIKESNLLEQQISELITNGIIHGNKNDPEKLIKVWYSFNSEAARIIVEDEGKGFKSIKKWNDFNRKRLKYLEEQNFKQLMNYISFCSPESSEQYSGNALFAAVEYWNAGLVFNDKCNAVAAKRLFG